MEIYELTFLFLYFVLWIIAVYDGFKAANEWNYTVVLYYWCVLVVVTYLMHNAGIL